jgi:hypothetical protein
MPLKPVGFFRELRHGDPDGPVLRDAVRDGPAGDEQQVVAYLKDAPVLVASPGLVDDVLDGSRRRVAALHIRTDGVWMWPSDLPYYVETYHVQVPGEFVRHMRRQAWKPPRLTDAELAGLEPG